MRPKSSTPETPSERLVRVIRRATRKQYSAEEKIRIVLDGLRGEVTIAELCRREGDWLAGMPGFEPGNGGIKIRCLTTWLHPNTCPTRCFADIHRSIAGPMLPSLAREPMRPRASNQREAGEP